MALFLVTRPNGASHLKNPVGLHGALVDAANGPAAITAANALAAAGVPKMDAPLRRIRRHAGCCHGTGRVHSGAGAGRCSGRDVLPKLRHS
ncbi:hypothetical protein [Pseudorhodobacter sp.]|uniref:hypothetical protein n=1 Tax=Pseudorhodobacter sp. TaxID=1934400 RepID=UPI002648FA75|nr:hypothetical protein [Pseudorhodobacter sp.]MDN5788818.1 hypothetical protein [Pseudorhodobacter sp.]